METAKAYINGMVHLMNKRRVQYLISLLLFVLLLGFGFFHSTKGIDIGESGYYVSSAIRYTMGDLPFRNEIISAIHPFDVLFSFVFRVDPNISLLELRYLGVTLHLLAALVLFLLLSRYAPPLFVALASGVMFLMNNFYGIEVFGYNSLSSDLSLISMVAWLYAIISPKRSSSFLFALFG